MLNFAYYEAFRRKSEVLSEDDIQSSAKTISVSRLDDLKKEYEAVLPGISTYVSAFSGMPPDLTVDRASAILAAIFQKSDHSSETAQQLEIFGDPSYLLRALYSVGFIGTHDTATNTYVFCHDGKSPDKEFDLQDRLLIHPCYWLALNLTRNLLQPGEAEEINDEFDIKIISETPDIRKARLGQLMSALQHIPLGNEGAEKFEDWCHSALKIIFAGRLRNIERKPNRNATQRRDIVATNQGDSQFWLRVLHDYQTRQVVFEIKNYEGIGVEEYRQIAGYLNNEYGRFAIVITRDAKVELHKGGDLDAFKEFYDGQKKLIVKLTAGYLVDVLGKIRNPQKRDVADHQLDRLVDLYIRLYAAGQTDSTARKSRKGRK